MADITPLSGQPGHHASKIAVLGRRNALAKVGAAVLFSGPLLATVDPVTPALGIAVELAAVPLFGLRYRTLARRAWPLLVSAIGVVGTLVLFAAERTGEVLVQLGPLAVTTGVLTTALGLALRVVAVALPGVLVFATTDPTDLADALIQHAKAPPRFAVGALAAFRLAPLMGRRWRALTLARRARGIEAGRNPVAAVRLFASTSFALLVGAIRQGTRLATAMDARGFDAGTPRTSARGFDAGTPRTSARRSRFGAADAALLVAAALAGALALATSILLGTFRPLIG